ncbi:hypothetical protein MNBD_GAMMA09-1954 [hydrothermal vent metagenome]|uniref:Uncharacterized protein n=1 Tax=hydrothermal vent metagenome TaxID=652676 RepID=A0A3B0Y494_9ZZZZ
MLRFYQIASLCCLFHAANIFAADINSEADSYITRTNAVICIQTNKKLDQARKQMSEVGADKELLKSKIHYLENEISKRRELIDRLDQHHYQENNANYNQLVIQFEELVEERKLTVNEFSTRQAEYVSQYHTVTQLEQQYSAQCIQQVRIDKELYDEVCQYEVISWCKSFVFN